ncbi:uncharacterized protein LOC134530755 [Bacillus rossius redtenbacheri]|uniref:uncharacterized protein LOC134530755 n=1 Tax=Bacillus rossius redtenbacheri TaxID=93214 RepID=UPI002FDD34DB
MAMDLINQVQQVKQKLEGSLFNITVDVNQIYEELEQHSVREDRVDFVASLFLNKFGFTPITSCTDSESSDDLHANMRIDEVTTEKRNEVPSAGMCVDGTFLSNRADNETKSAFVRVNSKVPVKSLLDLQADVKVEVKPCKNKDTRDHLGLQEDTSETVFSLPSSSRVSNGITVQSSSAELDFDYDVNNNDPNNNTEYEIPSDPVSSSIEGLPPASLHEHDDYNDVEFIDQEHIREKLLGEARVIHTVVPQRTFGEIFSFLESNLDNENRLQVVMKYFLNQDFPNEANVVSVVSKSSLRPKSVHCTDEVIYVDDDCCKVKDPCTQETPKTKVVSVADSELHDDSSLLCDRKITGKHESETDVIFVESVRNGKRHSSGKTEASPTKKIKNSSQNLYRADSEALDLSLNISKYSCNTSHKHFDAVKEMFPNLGYQHLAKVCSRYGETDDDLLRIVDDLLETVSSLGKMCEPAVEPLPTLQESGLMEKNYLFPFISTEIKDEAVDEVPEYQEAEQACNVEQKRNLVTVFQQASSSHGGPSSQETSVSSRKNSSSSTFVDGIAPPLSIRPVSVDGSSSSHSTSYEHVAQNSNIHVVGGNDTEHNRVDTGDINKTSSSGMKAGKAAGRENSKSEEVAAIVAASCARFAAPTIAVENVTSTKVDDLASLTFPLKNKLAGIQLVPLDKLLDQSKTSAEKLLSNTSSGNGNQKQNKSLTAIAVQKTASHHSHEHNHSVNRKRSCSRHGKTSLGTNKPVKKSRKGARTCDGDTVAPMPMTLCNNHNDPNQPGTSGTQKNTPVADADRITSTNTANEDKQLAADDVTQDQQKLDDDRYECLLNIFPQADPTYLLDKCIEIGNDDEKMRIFIADTLEKKDYPTYQDYQKRMEVEKQKKKVTTEFSVESFLEIFPDPLKYFLEQKKAVHKDAAIVFLKNRYPRTRQHDILTEFKNYQFNLTKTCEILDGHNHSKLKIRRPLIVDTVNKQDLQFLQEVAFIENRQLIEDYIKNKESAKKAAFEEAKLRNELLECACCGNDEVLLQDIGTCNEGHLFCRECIQRGVEVAIGDCKTTFTCFTECDSEFSLKTLQKFLKASLLSKVLQQRQLEEVKAASIDGIEFCRFCNFATILPEEDKVFHCLNPECMQEFCRLCKEPNHIPKRCDEIEKSDQVKLRTQIENKMTEALIRECWNCKKPFIKEDGCNKMTCVCGAMMCYVCRQKVTDYKHFNGQGGTEYTRCPLYSTNDELHVEVVRQEAMKAKQEVLQQNPTVQLKHDPTEVLPEATQAHGIQAQHIEANRRLEHVMVRLQDMHHRMLLQYRQQRVLINQMIPGQPIPDVPDIPVDQRIPAPQDIPAGLRVPGRRRLLVALRRGMGIQHARNVLQQAPEEHAFRVIAPAPLPRIVEHPDANNPRGAVVQRPAPQGDQRPNQVFLNEMFQAFVPPPQGVLEQAEGDRPL